MSGEQIGGMDEAMRMAWANMLSLATQQGFTRSDILVLTMKTAHAILATTEDAMWPEADTPVQEMEARSLYHGRLSDLDRAVEILQRHEVPNREPQQERLP